MLFNSYQFIFLFLPIVLFVFFNLAKFKHLYAAGFLTLSSFFFYGYWDKRYIILLASSILFNYYLGMFLSKKNKTNHLLVFGIFVNLCLLGYYKYANFFLGNLNALFDSDFSLASIILPLGISFFTFTQIAFLVDCHRKEVSERNFIHYCLFVTYFPHLLAGPILHHKQMMPQFADKKNYVFNSLNISVGLFIFILGLFKKVILADGTIQYVKPIFDVAALNDSLTIIDSTIGVLAYTMQIYFDFSGYSDMAIGLSLLFNINLPLNFNSPYQSSNISDFWRRWHITLSNFLRDYLYIPLGGNRHGSFRKYANLFVTMFLGGLWHGAGWTFIIWGSLHGIYLGIHQFWMKVKKKLFPNTQLPGSQFLGVFLTFSCVSIAWVFFRADSFTSAINILKGMFGVNGIALPQKIGDVFPLVKTYLSENYHITFIDFSDKIPSLLNALFWLFFLMMISFFMPNTQTIAIKFKHFLMTETKYLKIGLAATTLAGISLYILSNLTKVTEFLYFNF